MKEIRGENTKYWGRREMGGRRGKRGTKREMRERGKVEERGREGGREIRDGREGEGQGRREGSTILSDNVMHTYERVMAHMQIRDLLCTVTM